MNGSLVDLGLCLLHLSCTLSLETLSGLRLSLESLEDHSLSMLSLLRFSRLNSLETTLSVVALSGGSFLRLSLETLSLSLCRGSL